MHFVKNTFQLRGHQPNFQTCLQIVLKVAEGPGWVFGVQVLQELFI